MGHKNIYSYPIPYVKLFLSLGLRLYPMGRKPSFCILSSKPCHSALSCITQTMLTRHGNPPALIAPAVDAITELLYEGGESEHRKLMEAEIFNVALKFHQNPLQRDLSLKLLCDIITHLCNAIILKEGLAKQLLDLFELVLSILVHCKCLFLYSSDPDTHLSQVLCQSLVADPRILGSSTFPRLLPMLSSPDRMRNPFVSKLVRQWAPDMVSRLIKARQVNIILKMFKYACSVIELSTIAYDVNFQCWRSDSHQGLSSRNS